MKRKKRIENILLKSFNFLSIKVEDISILHRGHNNFNGKIVVNVDSLSNIKLFEQAKIYLEFNKNLLELI